jgi:hypothetical protein
MTSNSAYSKFLALDVGSTILLYEGVCSHDVVVSLSQELERILAASIGSRFKKVFGVFIELIQNIKNYSAEIGISTDGSESGIGIIRVSDESLCYTITAGNCIGTDAFERIQAKCEKIKTIPIPDLRAQYNEQIKRSQETTSKGAGLGFLDIAMKASGNWEYEFRRLNEHHVFFVITVYIAKGKVADDDVKVV